MSSQTPIEELAAMADTQMSTASRAHTSPTEASAAHTTTGGFRTEADETAQCDGDPDAGYLAHIAYQPDIRDLTDHDLIDCLRGSASVAGVGHPSPETVRERLALIAELNARGFTPEAIVAAIILGEVEGKRQADRRAANRMATEAAANSRAADHIKTSQCKA
jgi:hypothetical protein